MQQALGAAAVSIAATATPALAQEGFDACTVFTQPEAEAALGTTAAGEVQNPKVRRPKVVLACTYTGTGKDGQAVAANAAFKFSRTDAEAQKAFDDARLQFQTKPLYIAGAEAFWSAKTGQMNLRKGRTWLTLSVGSAKTAERELEPARKLAEMLARKL